MHLPHTQPSTKRLPADQRKENHAEKQNFRKKLEKFKKENNDYLREQVAYDEARDKSTKLLADVGATHGVDPTISASAFPSFMNERNCNTY